MGWVGVQLFRSGHDPLTPRVEVLETTATTVFAIPSTSSALVTGSSTTVATAAPSSGGLTESVRTRERGTSTKTMDVQSEEGVETSTEDVPVDSLPGSALFSLDSDNDVSPEDILCRWRPLSKRCDPEYETPEAPSVEFPPPLEVLLDWEKKPVEFRVLAVNDLDDGFAVVDLYNQVMKVYERGHHHLPGSHVTVAAFTQRGDVLIYPFGAPLVYVVGDGDFSVPPRTISPSRHVKDEYIEALGDRLGENVWLLQRTPAHTTLVDLVRVEDDTVVSTVELDGTYYISGLVDDNLYVVGDDDGRGDLVVSPSGAVSEVVSCMDHSTEYGILFTVGVFGHHFACLTLEVENHLVFYDGTTEEVDVIEAFESGKWSAVFLPDIPMNNTTGNHGDKLLLRLRDVTNPPYITTKAVYVADLSDHAVRLVYEHDRGEPILPLGIVDGLLIARAGTPGESSIVVIELKSREWHTVVDLPDGYFVYDAK